MKKRRLLLAVVSITALCAGCNFIAAPQRNQPSCPAIAGSLANIEPKDLSADARGYLTRYSLPTTDVDAWCRYLEQMQHDHTVKVEEGVLDMMGDYFLTTQTIETGYYFTYKVPFPDREIQKIILDRLSSERKKRNASRKAIVSDRA